MKRWTMACAMALWLAACATSPQPGDPPSDADFDALPAEVRFVPAAYRADVQHMDGPHRDLYDAPSFALWVGRPVAEAKHAQAQADNEFIEPGLSRDALRIIEDFILIELHLESAFGDMSVSYDAVAMRSMDARLVLPDGTSHAPVQRVLGRLLEADDGALKRFKRYNLLVFPRKDFLTGQPLIPSDVPSVALVLEGYNTRFEFEWENLAWTGDTGRMRALEAVDYARVGFQDLFLTVRRLSHVFD